MVWDVRPPLLGPEDWPRVEDSLAALYNENSKLAGRSLIEFRRGIELFESDTVLVEGALACGKTYPLAQKIRLPPPCELNTKLLQVLTDRSSASNFSASAPALEGLSTLLRWACGQNPRQARMRTYPSAGRLYPVECYILVDTIVACPPGIYHYQPRDHSLEVLPSDLWSPGNLFMADPRLLAGAAAFIVLSAVIARSWAKYGERGYRFALLEAGHIGQNLCLLATALSIGILALGGALEPNLETLLDLDGVNETIIYAFALGSPGGHDATSSSRS